MVIKSKRFKAEHKHTGDQIQAFGGPHPPSTETFSLVTYFG